MAFLGALLDLSPKPKSCWNHSLPISYSSHSFLMTKHLAVTAVRILVRRYNWDCWWVLKSRIWAKFGCTQTQILQFFLFKYRANSDFLSFKIRTQLWKDKSKFYFFRTRTQKVKTCQCGIDFIFSLNLAHSIVSANITSDVNVNHIGFP